MQLLEAGDAPNIGRDFVTGFQNLPGSQGLVQDGAAGEQVSLEL